MRKHVAGLSGVLAVLAGGPLPADDPAGTLPELNNYAWGFPVELTDMASFYTVALPFDVYVAAADPELRDIAVYNASGQAVPRTVESGAADIGREEALSTLPFAPLFRDRQPDPDAVRLIFERMSGDTRIDLRSQDNGSAKIRPPLSAYIVDARDLDGPLHALDLRWPDALQGFVGEVQVAGSDDLLNWRPLGSGALADLREQATDIRRGRIALQEADVDFLRVTWTGLPGDWRASGIDAVQFSQTVEVVRFERELRVGEIDGENGLRYFEADATLRVDRLGLVMSEPNTVVDVSVEYRRDGSDRWEGAWRGTAYRLDRGSSVVRSEPAAIEPVRARHWRVRLHGGNPGDGLRLVLGWRPDTLLFVAQGTGPYTLAVGRPGAAAENFPENRLLGEVSLGGLATDNGPVASATLGERFPLGGIVREPATQPIDWRTVLLWAVLIGAVLFVAWMAWRILRSHQNRDSARNTDL